MRKLWKDIHELFIPSQGNTYRPYLLRKPWLIFFLTIVLTTEGVFVASLLSQQKGHVLPAAVVPGEVIALTNVERVRANDSLLSENALLDAAAQAKANDMAKKGYFSHVGPDGKEPWSWIAEAHYAYRYAGENLAVRFDDSANVVNAWMASPTHRDNIVKGVYTDIGVGVADGTYEGENATFVVQYFGTPPGVAQAALASSSPAQTSEVAAAASAGSQVAGASTPEPAHESSAQSNSIMRQVSEVIGDSSQGTSWVLGGTILLVLFLLSLAFFIHIEIQSHELLIGGALVAGAAMLFLGLNMQLPSTAASSQSAAVMQIKHSVLVGEEGAQTYEATSSVPAL
jgi:hypothetical protein